MSGATLYLEEVRKDSWTEEIRPKVEEAFRSARASVYGDEEKLIEQTRNERHMRSFAVFEHYDDISELQIQGVLVIKAMPSAQLFHDGVGYGLEIVTLMVIDPLQNSGKGIGRKMLSMCLRLTNIMRLGAMFVPVHEKLRMLRGFYQRHGFTSVCTEDISELENHKNEWMACVVREPTPIKVLPRMFQPLKNKERHWLICKYNSFTFGVRIGDQIKVFCEEDDFACSVTDVRYFQTSSDMIQDIGAVELFPDHENVTSEDARQHLEPLGMINEGLLALCITDVYNKISTRLSGWIVDMAKAHRDGAPPAPRKLFMTPGRMPERTDRGYMDSSPRGRFRGQYQSYERRGGFKPHMTRTPRNGYGRTYDRDSERDQGYETARNRDRDIDYGLDETNDRYHE